MSSSYVFLLHCNDVKEWSLWNLIKQFVTLWKQTSWFLCFVLLFWRNAKSGHWVTEKSSATSDHSLAWKTRTAFFFFTHSSVGRWKPAVSFSTDGIRREKHVELRAAPSLRPGGLKSSPCSCSRSHAGSGGDHALVPLAVGHAAPVVIGHAALVGLLLASVQEGLQGLTLTFWLAHHVAGAIRPHAARRPHRWAATFTEVQWNICTSMLCRWFVNNCALWDLP